MPQGLGESVSECDPIELHEIGCLGLPLRGDPWPGIGPVGVDVSVSPDPTVETRWLGLYQHQSLLDDDSTLAPFDHGGLERQRQGASHRKSWVEITRPEFDYRVGDVLGDFSVEQPLL